MYKRFKIILSKFITRKKNTIPVAVSLNSKQPLVFFKTKRSKIDVTNKNTLVALKPLIISVAVSEMEFVDEPLQALEIFYAKEKVGTLILSLIEEVNCCTKTFCIFKVVNFKTTLINPIQLRYGYIFLWLQNKTSFIPYNTELPSFELYKIYTFYLIPKPVVLVTVFFEGYYDIFPMDNIGHISNNLFLLGLRNTSPSISKIKATKKICISHVPYNKREQVYKLGTHHKDGKVDLAKLGFTTVFSEKFGYVVPDFFIEIKELEVLEAKAYGSHTLFVTQIVHQYNGSNEKSMAHIPWFAAKFYNLNT